LKLSLSRCQRQKAAEVAVLESLPQLPALRPEQKWISAARADAQPIAAGTSGHAAAAAPALEKSEPVVALKPSLHASYGDERTHRR